MYLFAASPEWFPFERIPFVLSVAQLLLSSRGEVLTLLFEFELIPQRCPFS